MQLVYANRTGNVEKLISRLGISALKIESGEEKVSERCTSYIYGRKGILPPTVENLAERKQGWIKGSSSQRNSQRHPDTFCKVANALLQISMVVM